MEPKQQGQQQWRVVPRAGQRDTGAKKAWRNNEPHTDNVLIPVGLIANVKECYIIARTHRVWLMPSGQKLGDCLVHNIWGDEKAVAAAKAELTRWHKKATTFDGSMKKKEFSKLHSLTEKGRQRAEKQWEEDVKRAKFGQHPPHDMKFNAVGTFHWPVDEYPPQEWLGADFQALDPIRMDCSSYVVFDEERKIFRVMGKAAHVKDALKRLRTACLQVVMMGQITPEKKYFIHWPGDEKGAPKMPAQIVMTNHRGPASLGSDSVSSSGLRRSPRGIGWRQQGISNASRDTALNRDELNATLLRKLRDLRYLRGEIEMIVRLGTFIVTESPKRSHLTDKLYSLSEYTKMVKMPVFAGKVSENIGDSKGEKPIRSALHQSGLITPQSAMIQDLNDVNAIYSATFVFLGEGECLCLNVAWEQAIDSYANAEFDMVSHKWTRCSYQGPTKVLEASMTNLNTGLAWMFDIEAMEPVDASKLAPSRERFRLSLKLDANAVKSSGVNEWLVRYPTDPDLVSYRQSMDYVYNVRSCDYTLKLCHYRDLQFARKNRDGVNAKFRSFDPCWKLELSRTAWGTMFAQNTQLEIGNLATWEADVDSWFSSDDPGGDGWAQLMDELCKIERVVAPKAGC